jgi:hypothetical protein
MRLPVNEPPVGAQSEIESRTTVTPMPESSTNLLSTPFRTTGTTTRWERYSNGVSLTAGDSSVAAGIVRLPGSVEQPVAEHTILVWSDYI